MLPAFVLAIFITVPAALSASDKCVLPTPDENQDLNMLMGNWYEILNSGDLYDKVGTCVKLRDTKAVGKNFYGVFEDINLVNNEIKHSYMPWKWVQEKNSSAYSWDPKFKYLIEDSIAGTLNRMKVQSETREESKKELDDLKQSREVFITDYENYLLGISCSGDRRYVWVLSHNPVPTAEDILRIHNKFIELGSGWEKISLVLARCDQIQKYIDLPPY